MDSSYADFTRLFVESLGTHPDILYRQDSLLCSINERLGAGLKAIQSLCDSLGHPIDVSEAGSDFEPIGNDIINDIIMINQMKNEEREEIEYQQNTRQQENKMGSYEAYI